MGDFQENVGDILEKVRDFRGDMRVFFWEKKMGIEDEGELSDSKKQFMRFSKSVVESKKGNCWIKKGNCWIPKKGEGLGLQIEYVEVYEGGAKNGKIMSYARTRPRV